jgi:hypothetical protein
LIAMARPAFERRLISALDANPSRIPVVLGGCGSGRSEVLFALRDRLGRSACQYVNVERTATTPERFHRAIVADSPFPPTGDRDAVSSPRRAFDRTLGFFDQARASGGLPATFLLDEVLEFRTFESFPGLRNVLHDLVRALASSPNRFVLTSRYTARSQRALREATSRFEVIPVAPLSVGEIRETLPETMTRSALADEAEVTYVARTVHALTDGRPAYVRALADALAALADARTSPDLPGTLATLMAPGGLLHRQCGACYELRLHRARGYGALKAILEILAEEEPLTLTEVSQRLHRTPGSTKDYLSWLEDVDLVTARQKRYSFTDPVLGLWVRLHCRPAPPSLDEVRREVQRYAAARAPQPEPAMALVGSGGPPDDSSGPDSGRGKVGWGGIIEID